jgi:hypothetical protein
MRHFETIPEYSIRVLFYPNQVQCYDLISKQVVCSKTRYLRFWKVGGMRSDYLG